MTDNDTILYTTLGYPPKSRGLQPARSMCCRHAAVVALALVVALLCGCERGVEGPRTATATQSADEVSIDLTTPENAARSVLTCLRAELRAIADRDRAAAERYRGMLPTMAAKKEILSSVRRQMRAQELTAAQAIERFTGQWGAIIAYYSEGLQLDQLRRAPVADNTAGIYVFVPARGADDNAVLRIRCVRGADEFWRVAGLDFHTPPPASQAAPQRTP